MTEKTNEQIEDETLNEAMAHLTKAAELLGFMIAIPNPGNDENAIVEGFLVGTENFINKYTKAVDGK